VTYVGYKHTVNDQIILTFVKHPGLIGRMFGRKPRTFEYVGRSTVWHTFPEFRRCGVWLEGDLSEIWDRIQYEEALLKSQSNSNGTPPDPGGA
jgi:hypothetical protein